MDRRRFPYSLIFPLVAFDHSGGPASSLIHILPSPYYWHRCSFIIFATALSGPSLGIVCHIFLLHLTT
ncbi:hypothetical protein BX661DRAFT_86007 [Kickxella alabastrina]|uniref:uncharacterized protein n=1 Tax=Kickxella alabastrina TaxID=61397 RepID=UPI00221FDA84|nr:uncharacterized protein BX661DRAFT_86007 [Kickxella alabastrina]KAI7831932.1 hypothetical protein BX661DRAFT_86007 [Kickxella alabastrina]